MGPQVIVYISQHYYHLLHTKDDNVVIAGEGMGPEVIVIVGHS